MNPKVDSPTPIVGTFFDSIKVTSIFGHNLHSADAVNQPDDHPPTINTDFILKFIFKKL